MEIGIVVEEAVDFEARAERNREAERRQWKDGTEEKDKTVGNDEKIEEGQTERSMRQSKREER